MALTKDDSDNLYEVKHEINETKCTTLPEVCIAAEKALKDKFGPDFQLLASAHFECWVKGERVGAILVGLKQGNVMHHQYVDVRGLP